MFVIAYCTPFQRLWLAPSPIMAEWLSVTSDPAKAARFHSASEAYKARDAHHARAGVLRWQVAVRPENNSKASS